MHGQGAAAARETVYQDAPETQQGGSLLDAILEMGVRETPRPVPVADGWLDQVEAPTKRYGRGRRLVVRDVVVARQDSDVLCQGGLFGAVEASSTPQGHMAAIQSGLFAEVAGETARKSVCVVCGDARCGIGPFGGVR